ncbi:hypothetical protein D3C84_1048400 [compost metagenome]
MRLYATGFRNMLEQRGRIFITDPFGDNAHGLLIVQPARIVEKRREGRSMASREPIIGFRSQLAGIGGVVVQILRPSPE